MWKPDPDKNRWYEWWAVTAWIALWAVVPGWAYALPSGEEIVSGSGSIEHTAQELTVPQDGQRLITNWQTFSIGSAESVTFQQPGVNSIALNISTEDFLNGNVVGSGPAPAPVLDTDSLQQGSLGTFLTDFLKNGGPSC